MRYLCAIIWLVSLGWVLYDESPTKHATYYVNAEGPYYCHICMNRFHDDGETISCSTCKWEISTHDYKVKVICPICNRRANKKDHHLDCSHCDYHLPHKMWEDSYQLFIIFGITGTFLIFRSQILDV